MKGGSSGKNYCYWVSCHWIWVITVCDVRDNSVPRDEIIKVQDRPKDHSVVEFRNIYIVLAKIVCRIVPIPLIWSSYRLHPSPVCTWTWSIVWKLLIWSSHLILVIRFQKVRGLGQLLEHVFTHPSSTSRATSSHYHVIWFSILVGPLQAAYTSNRAASKYKWREHQIASLGPHKKYHCQLTLHRQRWRRRLTAKIVPWGDVFPESLSSVV